MEHQLLLSISMTSDIIKTVNQIGDPPKILNYLSHKYLILYPLLELISSHDPKNISESTKDNGTPFILLFVSGINTV